MLVVNTAIVVHSWKKKPTISRKKMKKNIPLEDLPTRESTGKYRQFGYNAKETRTRDHRFWSASYNYLASKVGSEWDYVWADICRHHDDFDKNALRKYMREQISQGFMVTTKCSRIYGIIAESGYTRLYSKYYVDPDTDILRRNNDAFVKWKREKRRPRVVKFEGKEYAPDNNGIWYEVKLVEITPMAIRFCVDTLLNIHLNLTNVFRNEYGRDVFCVEKKQISKRLKRRILRNADAN
jgi:hypothetical protein